MNANIWFDVAALWLLIVQWYILLLRRNIVSGQIRRYRVTLLLITVATIGDFISTLSDLQIYHHHASFLTHPDFMIAASTVYYLSHSFTMVAFVMYLSALFKLDESNELVRIIYGVPAIVIISSIAMNLLTGQIFYYDADGIYHRGPFVYLIYIIAMVYLAYALFILFRYTRNMQPERRLTLFSMVIFVVISNFIQFVAPTMRVENFAVTLVGILVYLFVESPTNYFDSQTGLLSVESFFVHFSIASKNRTPMRLLFLSLDDIDEWYREVGKTTTDAAIVSVAVYLQGLERVAEVYRINRCLFVLSLKDTKEDDIEELIEDIRVWFARSIVVGNYKIGLASCTMRVDCPDQVMTVGEIQGVIEMMADIPGHRNRSSLTFDELGIETHNRTKQVDIELREGISHDRYRFGYQPIYSMTAGRFSHIDTDVSFLIDGVGEVRFSKALSIAEQNGSIDEMYAFIVESVCATIEKEDLQAYGIHTVDIKMPMTQLLKQETIDRVVGIIDKHHISHEMIIFELQEESLENYEGQIKSGIEQLYDRGFHFVLNNYGYGFTNAEILVKMPLVAVTLDNRLTMAGGKDEKADKLLRATMQLLNGLGLRAKAEHIETEAQEAYAKDLGCELLQGYYFVGLLYDGELRAFLEEQQKKGGAHAV